LSLYDVNKEQIFACTRGFVDQHHNVRDSLKIIDEKFITFDKFLTNTIIMYFSSLKLNKTKGVRDHIICIRDTMAQLKALEVIIFYSLLVHYILYTLPHQYTPFRIACNTHKDKWFINESMTMYVQEEEKMLMEEGQMVNFINFLKNKKNQVNKKENMFSKPV